MAATGTHTIVQSRGLPLGAPAAGSPAACVISHCEWWARTQEPGEERSEHQTERPSLEERGCRTCSWRCCFIQGVLVGAFSGVWRELKSSYCCTAWGHLQVARCTWAPVRPSLLPRQPGEGHQRRARGQQAKGPAPPTPRGWAVQPEPHMVPLPPDREPPKAGVHELCTPLCPGRNSACP